MFFIQEVESKQLDKAKAHPVVTTGVSPDYAPPTRMLLSSVKPDGGSVPGEFEQGTSVGAS